MNKPQAIKVIDLFSFISLILIISTGAFLKFTLPPRSGGATVWDLTRHQWGEIHFYISIFFLLMMSIHLVFHFSFIKKAVLGKASREQNYRLIIGAVSLFVLILFSLAPLFSPVDTSNEQRHEKPRHNQQ